MDASRIRELIEHGLRAQGHCDVRVDVEGADGVHFDARVISAAFTGKRSLIRHKIVYATLGEQMGNAIHALALTTLTPEELIAREQVGGASD